MSHDAIVKLKENGTRPNMQPKKTRNAVKEATRLRDLEVKILYDKGLTLSVIKDKLGITQGQLISSYSRLLKNGSIKRRNKKRLENG